MTSTELYWLPAIRNFRDELRSALAEQRPDVCFDRLASLSRHRLGFLETIQLDRAAAERAAQSPGQYAKARLAILASTTVDHLAPAIRVAGLRRRMRIETHTGAYGQYRQEVLDRASALARFAPEVVLFSLSARDAIAGLPISASSDQVEQMIARTIGDIRSLWREVRDLHKAAVVQQTFLNFADPVFGSYDGVMPAAPSNMISRLNVELGRAASSDGVVLLDITRMSERQGLDAWFDVTRWLQAKQEIAPQAAPLYGELLVRVIGARRGSSSKCLVMDLDNTLWGGVIGDDGLGGIVLGQGTAAGEAYLAFQAYARTLKERGIILAVCSKNDPAIAEAAFRDHPEMVLRRNDITAFVANWQDKAENLKSIAATLNIGLDSLVFVDDNPVERARVRESLPMVAVPELPDDCAQYARCVADAGYFEAVSFTAEDVQRAGQYAANAERDDMLRSAGSLDDFLRNLDMTMTCGPIAPVDLQRATQLINKTNQFNVTTQRYTPERIAVMADAPAHITLQFRLVDRFGDNGLVSVMLLRPLAEDPGVMEIDTWVMSCRVFGRQLEFAGMNVAVEAAVQAGVREIRAAYIPTAKNDVVRDLYRSLGFQPMGVQDEPDGATRWAMDVARYTPHKTWIKRT